MIQFGGRGVSHFIAHQTWRGGGGGIKHGLNKSSVYPFTSVKAVKDISFHILPTGTFEAAVPIPGRSAVKVPLVVKNKHNSNQLWNSVSGKFPAGV